jgi:NAD(P)H-nitrite reductase large subunit
LRARELDPAVEITVLLADRHPNYSTCGLPHLLSRDVPDWRALTHRSADELEQAGVELLLEPTAIQVDPPGKSVTPAASRWPKRFRHAASPSPSSSSAPPSSDPSTRSSARSSAT